MVNNIIIYSCETHVNHALDVFVAKQVKFPIMKALSEKEKLSTCCTYCTEPALYVVANE
ncbi:CxxH/CxxC protein [Sporosarcina sp. G11-34]|uniref:CxxH/CxxC protein n=1 Tax=Sporosarcina sp. G11-34 TaxID=2849605 RepID=UPI003FA7B073